MKKNNNDKDNKNFKEGLAQGMANSQYTIKLIKDNLNDVRNKYDEMVNDLVKEIIRRDIIIRDYEFHINNFLQTRDLGSLKYLEALKVSKGNE